MTSSWPTVLGVESLNFSMCGTQIVIKFCGQILPEVHSLLSDPVYQWTLNNCKTRSEGYAYSQMQSSSQTKTSYQNESAVGLRSASLGFGQIAASGSTFHEVVLSANPREREVQVLRRSEGGETAQPLVSLPNWHGTEDASFNVHAPKTREGKIGIILNKVAQPWYSLSDPADVHLPALVQKDVRALGLLRKRNVRGELVRCDRENRLSLVLEEC
jgi:hypothetical protein